MKFLQPAVAAHHSPQSFGVTFLQAFAPIPPIWLICVLHIAGHHDLLPTPGNASHFKKSDLHSLIPPAISISAMFLATTW